MSSAPQVDVREQILGTAQLLMGRRGFASVGLTELLKLAGVPKGSFYYYFSSKEVFGEALLENYFVKYLQEMDSFLSSGKGSAGERLMSYWTHWLTTQASDDPDGKCLAVQLGAEVSELSEPMRKALHQGTAKIIQKLSDSITDGLDDRSLSIDGNPHQLATALYQMWLGASVLAKITHDREPLVSAHSATRLLLHLPNVT